MFKYHLPSLLADSYLFRKSPFWHLFPNSITNGSKNATQKETLNSYNSTNTYQLLPLRGLSYRRCRNSYIVTDCDRAHVFSWALEAPLGALGVSSIVTEPWCSYWILTEGEGAWQAEWEEYKWAGTQSTRKGLVRGDWKEGWGMLFCTRARLGVNFTGEWGAIKSLKAGEWGKGASSSAV